MAVSNRIGLLCAFTLAAFTLVTNGLPASAHNVTASPEAAAKRDFFYVGGTYVQSTGAINGTSMSGQMYVERLTPPDGARYKYPLVFWHGGAQTGTNWLNTPDGRKGWASYFLEQGYEVYLLDTPERGRSFSNPYEGKQFFASVETIESSFTAPETFNQYPQAHLHTQWPGTGKRGDPTFDAFYASQVQQKGNISNAEQLSRNAGAALLDKIGDAIVITHSEAGPYGWGVAELRPQKVKGILALEPSGPPFESKSAVGSGTQKKPYGITVLPLAYDPPVNTPEELKTVQHPPPSPDLSPCTLQADPARRLVNLGQVPVHVISSEASYHAPYDYCTVEFLKQAGVDTQWTHLPDVGIHGNGHFIFLEKNNLDIACLAKKWLDQLCEK